MVNQVDTFDVAISGAGPAGSLAAILAAEAGLSVVLIEKRELPRTKACGGLVSSAALSLLPADLPLETICAKSVSTIKVLKRNKEYQYFEQNNLGLLLKRSDFDFLLTQYAQSKGVVLRENSTVKRITRINKPGKNNYLYSLDFDNSNVRRIVSRYFIGADGARGNSAILCGLRRNRPTLAGLGLTRIDENNAGANINADLIFYPLPSLGGIYWAFRGNGWTNEGIAGLASQARLRKTFAEITSSPLSLIGLQAWPLPFLGPLLKPGAKSAMLIGDAAGLVDPFSGEGLHNSLLSAILVIKAITEAERNKSEASSVYEKYYHNYFRRRFTPAFARAVYLHARTLVLPSLLPQTIASLMLPRKSIINIFNNKQ